LNNSIGNICMLVNYHGGQYCDGDLKKAGLAHFIDQKGSAEAEWAWFPGASQLEFVNISLGIDTSKAGLVCDEWRRKMPAKSAYRPWVKDAFEGVPSAAPGGSKYTPEAAQVRAGLRSGKYLIGLNMPCPPVATRDCEGAWLAWGECEAGGRRTVRWTVEQPATGGGKQCQHLDGDTQQVAC
jgi:hypothetical protein